MVEKKNKEIKKKLTEKEIEKIVLDMAKKGMTSEKIGLELKSKHNTNTKIGKILKKNKVFLDPDINNLEKKVEKLKKHIEKNKHDYRTKRAFSIKNAKLKKLKEK
ncbi:MAG: hypothetical protein ABIG37_03855 [Nanoarchaeota archaeon]|nr:hypothetical protein [Nanoarchaeota archaeon]